MGSSEEERTKSNSEKRTEILCPECGKRSDTKIRWGEISIHCRRCKKNFDVIIQLPRSNNC